MQKGSFCFHLIATSVTNVLFLYVFLDIFNIYLQIRHYGIELQPSRTPPLSYTSLSLSGANYHPKVGVCHFDYFITYVCIHK